MVWEGLLTVMLTLTTGRVTPRGTGDWTGRVTEGRRRLGRRLDRKEKTRRTTKRPKKSKQRKSVNEELERDTYLVRHDFELHCSRISRPGHCPGALPASNEVGH